MGRNVDELIALHFINKALELLPGDLKAINIQNGIMAEYDIPFSEIYKKF